MAKFEYIFNFLGHYKYLITIVFGCLFLFLLSENSIVNLIKLDMQKADLEEEIERYNKQDADSRRQLDELKTNPNAVEKVARERYFMKKDNEDVFVLSTDQPTNNTNDNNDKSE